MNTVKSQAIDKLFDVILSLDDISECYDFFEDLCTVKELKEMSQRLEVAFLLHKGLGYQEIADRTRVSTATISRIKKCLEYGSGGYLEAIEKYNVRHKERD